MLKYASNATPTHDVHYALPDPCSIESNLALMRLRRNEEEVLELHALGRSARCKLDSLHLPEHERHGVPELHASKMDANA